MASISPFIALLCAGRSAISHQCAQYEPTKKPAYADLYAPSSLVERRNSMSLFFRDKPLCGSPRGWVFAAPDDPRESPATKNRALGEATFPFHPPCARSRPSSWLRGEPIRALPFPQAKLPPRQRFASSDPTPCASRPGMGRRRARLSLTHLMCVALRTVPSIFFTTSGDFIPAGEPSRLPQQRKPCSKLRWRPFPALNREKPTYVHVDGPLGAPPDIRLSPTNL